MKSKKHHQNQNTLFISFHFIFFRAVNIHTNAHIYTHTRGERVNMKQLHPSRFHGCLKCLHGGMLTQERAVVTATPMTRLDVGELLGWRLSFSQSRQTGHALFNDYPSICPLSLISVWKPAKTSTKTLAGAQTIPSRQAAPFWLPSSNFISI